MAQQLQAKENPLKQTPQTKQDTDQPHANELNEPIPHVGQPLDGRHYLDVLEEQQHADAKPELDGENPRHPDIESEKK